MLYWDVVVGYMVLVYGTGIWYFNMVLRYGTGIWYWEMLMGYRVLG